MSGVGDTPEERVRIRPAELSDEVKKERDRHAEVEADNTQVLRERIELHLKLQRALTARMAAAHQDFVDHTDFDPAQPTRPAAAWLTAGRCLGYASSITTQLDAGFTAEVDPTARALEEASRLMLLLVDPLEPMSWKKWMRNSWMKISELDRAEKAQHKRQAASVQRRGFVPPESTQEPSKQIYGSLSETAHPQRKNIEQGWTPEIRRYLHGPQARVVNQAAWVHFGDAWVQSAYVAVGTCLMHLQPPRERLDYINHVVEPGLQYLQRVQRAAPLAPETLESMGAALG